MPTSPAFPLQVTPLLASALAPHPHLQHCLPSAWMALRRLKYNLCDSESSCESEGFQCAIRMKSAATIKDLITKVIFDVVRLLLLLLFVFLFALLLVVYQRKSSPITHRVLLRDRDTYSHKHTQCASHGGFANIEAVCVVGRKGGAPSELKN